MRLEQVISEAGSPGRSTSNYWHLHEGGCGQADPVRQLLVPLRQERGEFTLFEPVSCPGPALFCQRLSFGPFVQGKQRPLILVGQW